MAHLIGLDWGTSSFRAYLINLETGRVVDKRISCNGILKLQKEALNPYLLSQVGQWLTEFGSDIPIIGSGMVGSERGLTHLNYLSCPINIAEIANHLVKVESPNFNLHLVPGLRFDIDSQTIETMRGEESQIFGLENYEDEFYLCMPGTHCKWVRLANGVVLDFRSAITGELFSTLKQSSMIRGEQVWSDSTFELGVTTGLRGENILYSLFRARSLSNFKIIQSEHAESFVSGLLIASEISGMADIFLEKNNTQKLLVVGSDYLCRLYGKVLDQVNIDFEIRLDESVAVVAYPRLLENFAF